MWACACRAVGHRAAGVVIAALFVQDNGCYFGIPDIDPWPKRRDARLYEGPHPVVAHPPCERWGRYWAGAPWQPRGLYRLGDDGGCFEAALYAVRRFGGVLEHPEGSHAWGHFGLPIPERHQGWRRDLLGGASCYVEQGHYGHIARKGTWLFAISDNLPELIWSPCEQRLPAYAVERYGRQKASRIGMMATLSSRSPQRASTPPRFRDVLISIAERL